MTLDEVLTLASIVQWEAGNLEDMYKVARVLRNRLDNPTVYPKLECDSTQRYINSITPSSQEGQVVENLDYDTYKRNGLPVGPINNPGRIIPGPMRSTNAPAGDTASGCTRSAAYPAYLSNLYSGAIEKRLRRFSGTGSD